MSDWGVDLPLDMLMCTLTSILHVKLGKYELSELKSFILILGVFEGVLHLTWLYNANWLFTTQIIQKWRQFHLFLKNPKWLPNISHNIYPIMHLWGVDLPVDMLIWNLKLSFLATRYQTNGVDVPVDVLIWNLKLPFLATGCQTWALDLLMCTLTSILHVKLGKYELSELKSFIPIWTVLRGCYIWHDSTMLTDCLLLKLFSDKRKFPPFLAESKMAAKYMP